MDKHKFDLYRENLILYLVTYNLKLGKNQKCQEKNFTEYVKKLSMQHERGNIKKIKTFLDKFGKLLVVKRCQNEHVYFNE